MQDIYPIAMLFSIITFTFAGVLTPGPNNIMLLSSGLTFGYKRTIPHILGIVLGFTFMVICVGIGVGVVFKMFPFIFTILKYIGISYLFWMAWHIASLEGGIDAKKSSAGKPFSFWQATIFQWVNPKAWVMAITLTATFTTSKEHAFAQVLLISVICLLCGIISTNSWTLGGVYIKKFIKNSLHVRVFNIVMATAIVISILPFIFE